MSLLKPSIQTPFHIDFEWWEQNDRDWRVYLRSLLCAEHQKSFADLQEGAMIDWINPETAEVKPVDGIQHALMSHCALLADFVSEHTAVVEAVFRIFLANGNQPMSVEDLSKRLNRQPETILRTLSGLRVYRGLRPYQAAKPQDAVEEIEVSAA